jgi:putative ABC transport system permease protein
MPLLSDLGRDLRTAARTLRRKPSFSVLAVTVLALGLGGATTMFSILDALLLRPLPFPESGRLVRIHRTVAADGSDNLDRQHSYGAFFTFQAQHDVFQSVAAISMGGGGRLETAAGQPTEMLLGASVNPDYFPTFHVRPRLGRVFSAEEYQRGNDRVILLSTQLWQSHFGSDPGVVGRTVRVDGVPLTVIGVMPPELHDPVRYWQRGLFWRPLVFPPGAANNYRNEGLRLVARLAPGVSFGTAQAAVRAIAHRLDTDHQTGSSAALVTPQSAGALNVAGIRVLWLSMGLALLVHLLTCINLAGVQLARLANRGHDLAVRAALGAGRGRLVRELVTESLLLSLLGCAAGILIAYWFTDLLASRITVGFRWVTVGVPAYLDARALGFSVALALLTAVVVGTVPAWLGARQAVAQTLRQGGRGTASGSAGWPRLRQALVVAQMALALILLAAGGLFLRGLQRFVNSSPGWSADRLLTAQLDLRTDQPGEQRIVALQQLQQQTARLPGVESTALAGALPIMEDTWRSRPVWAMGTPRPRPNAGPTAFGNVVTPDYFQTVGIRLREGRLFNAADRIESATFVVNESMARGLWPRESAIGKRFGHPEADPTRPEQWSTVIGVVEDTRFAATLTSPKTRYQFYQPMAAARSVAVVLRTPGSPDALTTDLRRLIAQVAPGASLDNVVSARTQIDQTLMNFKLLGWMLFAFATLGLVVSALGVYSLFSGFVIQRTREIGVRMALGAQASQVLRLVLGKGMRLAMLGGVLGVAGAAVIARVLTSLAAELPAHEPIAVVVIAMAMLAVALFACWLPARRAARVDPMVALRQE